MKNIFRILSIALIFLALGNFSIAKGQSETKIWMTWRATTYVPPEYTNKILPIEESKMVVAVDLFRNGKIENLDDETIYWYQNDKFLTGGSGLTRIAITVPSGAVRGGLKIKASFPDRNGLAKTLSIPITSPQAIIQLPGKKVGASFVIQGKPYFFNASDPSELLFKWTISGKEPPQYNDPTMIQVSVNQSMLKGSTIPISLFIDSSIVSLESAKKDTSVIYE